MRIERCRIAHLHALLGSMRAEERAEFVAVGVAPRHGLIGLWKKTPEPWAALDDVGRVLAVWGDAAPVLASEGLPWVVTGRRIEEHPLWFFREVRRQIEKMLERRKTLRSGIGVGCEKALRFYEMLGFTIDEPVDGFHEARIGRHGCGNRAPPFIIYALPRSRTAWLSKFLTYGEWECRHEVAFRLRSIDDLKRALRRPCSGYAETAAGPAWRLIHHYRPDIRAVVVRRPVEETTEAMIAAGASAGISYDRDRLTRTMAYGERCLERISQLPDVLSIRHADLAEEDCCRRLFEFCLPYTFDREWWLSLRDKNVQVDLQEHFQSYQANKPLIELFKSLCKRELSSLRRSGTLNHA